GGGWGRREPDGEHTGSVRMKGYIYIAGEFETVNRSVCGQKGSWIDNDPHFWTQPPTWGICRNDFRANSETGDAIFFVLPIKGRHPQMIFAYLTIEKIITHSQAYSMADLKSKRMGNKMPNGNIIVDETDSYNRFDGGVHKYKFHKIRQHYALGDPNTSRMLSPDEINRLAPHFVGRLSQILGRSGRRPIDIISRKGRILTPSQVQELLAWINQS
ncbi:MAG: hypothetical protein ACJ76N_03810, partial [Thermoanaerobaculia bacterium]